MFLKAAVSGTFPYVSCFDGSIDRDSSEISETSDLSFLEILVTS